ncbi:MAG: oligosaccharide flippase family protein [Bdellovibrionaceae bacterium]|nr:oligosaccharide flippase family protein [Bdellovibrio sp.]
MIRVNKNLIFLFTGRLTQAVISILTIRLMTELLSQTEVGNQYIINSMILWFSLVLINPIGMFVNRHIHEWQKQGQLQAMVKNVNMYFLFIAVCSVPLLGAARYFLKVGLTIQAEPLLIYVGIYIFFSTWFQTLISFFNLFEFQKQFVMLNVISQILGLGMAVVAVTWLQPTGLSWLSGLLAGQILSLVLGIFVYKKYFPQSEINQTSSFSLFNKNTLIFCYPVALATLFMWFMNQGYRLYIEKYIGVEALATLGVALGLAASVAALIEALTTQYYYPAFYAKIAHSTLNDRQAAWQKLWDNTAIIYIPFCFLTMATAPFLVRLLTAEKFHHVTLFVLMGAFIELFRQMSNVAYLASHAEKKTQNTIAPYLFGSLLLVFLLAVLRNFGLLDIFNICLCLVGVGLLTLVFNVVVVKRVLNVKINYLNLLKVFIFALPLLIIHYFNNQSASLSEQFILSCIAGTYCLFIIYRRTQLAAVRN